MITNTCELFLKLGHLWYRFIFTSVLESGIGVARTVGGVFPELPEQICVVRTVLLRHVLHI